MGRGSDEERSLVHFGSDRGSKYLEKAPKVTLKPAKKSKLRAGRSPRIRGNIMPNKQLYKSMFKEN